MHLSSVNYAIRWTVANPKPVGFIIGSAAVQAGLMVGSYKILKNIQEKYDASGVIGKVIRIAESTIFSLGIIFLYVATSLIRGNFCCEGSAFWLPVGAGLSYIVVAASLVAKSAIAAGAVIKSRFDNKGN